MNTDNLTCSTVNILVLEDSTSAMLDITTKLQHTLMPLNILKAYDYQEAVNIVNQTPVDMAIVDLCMPGEKNGMDFIVDFMKANEATKNIPIIVVTSSGDDSLLKRALDGVVKRYLVKPVASNQLKSSTEEALTYLSA